MATKTEYSFTLLVEGGENFPTDDDADALFAAGCDDATPGASNGQHQIHFDRESASFLQAVKTAVRDIHKAKRGIRVIGIDGAGMVTQSQMADLLDVTRQYVNQLVGHKDFPAPAQDFGRGRQLWRWLSVARWLHHQNRMDKENLRIAMQKEMLNTRFSQMELEQLSPRDFAAVQKIQ